MSACSPWAGEKLGCLVLGFKVFKNFLGFNVQRVDTIFIIPEIHEEYFICDRPIPFSLLHHL